jgi:hypothetical protein
MGQDVGRRTRSLGVGTVPLLRHQTETLEERPPSVDAQAQIAKLFAAIDNRSRMEDIMRADERAKGYRVVLPGEVAWLPAEDWHPTVVVSIDGNRVRLVAILASQPGNGAFRRLVAAIRAADLIPIIIEPTREMRATLTRWRWKRRNVEYGFETEEHWRPRQTTHR